MKFFGAFVLALLLSHATFAAELFGTVDSVSGAVTVSGDSGSAPISDHDKIYVGQRITTGADGEVHIVTADNGLIALRPNSDMRVERYQAKGEDSDEMALSLLKGALRSITGWIAKRKPAAYRLQTASATIGVRGTDHETTVLETASGDNQPGTYDTVYEGATVVQTTRGNMEVKAGEHGFAAHEHAPILLARRPDFMQRTLKLEQRIQQRKHELGQAVKQRLADRAKEHKADVQNRREKAAQRLENRRLPRNQK